MIYKSTTDLNRRAIILGSVFGLGIVLLFCSLMVRVVQLQTAPPKRIASRLGKQTSDRTLLARRGTIFDRKGRELAVSRTATRLFADPKWIKDLSAFAQQVSLQLGFDQQPLYEKLKAAAQAKRRYVVITHQLTAKQITQVNQLNLPGLGTQTWVLRQYPQGPLAGQVLGVVGFEGQGLEGVELAFNAQLQGQSGQIRFLRDTKRQPLFLHASSTYNKPAQQGKPIQLTLDLTIQSFAQEALAQQCEKFRTPPTSSLGVTPGVTPDVGMPTITGVTSETGRANGDDGEDAQSETYPVLQGQLIVMNPQNGHILAMANYPPFDPGQLAGSSPSQRRNRCVTDVFEPGSVFKSFIWAAAVEAGKADPQEIIDCTQAGYYVSPLGRRLRDTHGHGPISFQQVLVKSSNIGMAIVGQRMTTAQMYHAVKRFGFGQSTGSLLPGEVVGIVNPLAKWNHYSQTSIPMGQEIGVTALQIVTALGAIANDGLMVSPVLRIDEHQQARGLMVQRAISKKTAKQTRLAMRQVVTRGTGRYRAYSKLFTLFGKTGTAQMPDLVNGGYLQDQYVASFIAGAPLNNPKLVVGCFIHKPNKKAGYYGGTVSAPAVKQVIEKTLMYMGVEPDVDDRGPGGL